MYYSLLSIALGSVLGAWLRWFLGLKLNPIYPQIPLGTVTVNLVGGFIIGFAIAYFAQSDLSPNYKLFVIHRQSSAHDAPQPNARQPIPADLTRLLALVLP